MGQTGTRHLVGAALNAALVPLLLGLSTSARAQEEPVVAPATETAAPTSAPAIDAPPPIPQPPDPEPPATTRALDTDSATIESPAPTANPPPQLLAPTNPPQLAIASTREVAPALDDLQLSVTELTAGVTAAAIAVPATLALAGWLGSVSSNLVLAALPALLVTALLPPAAVVAAEWGMAQWLAPDRETPWWALGAVALTQVGLVTCGVLAGVSVRQLPAAVVFGAIEVAVLPAMATAILRATRTDADPLLPVLDAGDEGGAP